MSQQNDQKLFVHNILFLTGIVMAVFGAFILSSPNTIAGLMFEDDILLSQISGGALVIAGLMDVILMKTVFNVRDRK